MRLFIRASTRRACGLPHRLNTLDRWVAARVQRTIAPAAVRLELWDGSSPYDASRHPIGDLIVGDRRTLLGLIVNPDLWFGEAYMAGRLEIRGSLEPIVEALSRLAPETPSWRERLAAAAAWPITRTGARRNVHHHYDLGNDFYAQWLDREMVYTCAYFATPAMSLEEAQRAKLDLVCRKLRLQPGETVVEAGCGWGALALHMARHYGVSVKAFNVSREQLAYARERAAREGLDGRVEFIDDDYRNVAGRFEAFVSVGMLEHVGLRQFHTLADVLRRTVRRDGGRGLLHFIGRDAPRPLNAWIRRRIFPGAYPPTLAEVTTRILDAGGHVGARRREPAAPLRADAGAMERAVRRRGRQVRARYGETLPRAHGSCISPAPRRRSRPDGCSCFRSSSRRCESTPPSWTRASSTRRAGDAAVIRCDALIVGGGPAGSTCARELARAPDGTSSSSIAPAFRATRSCAGWLTPEVFRLLELDPAEYRAAGLTLQEITGIPHRRPRRTPSIETRYRARSATPSAAASSTSFSCAAPACACSSGRPLAIAAARAVELDRQRSDRRLRHRRRRRALLSRGAPPPWRRTIPRRPSWRKKRSSGSMAATCARVAPRRPELFFCRDLEGYAWCVPKGRLPERRHRSGESAREFSAHVQGLHRVSRASGMGLKRASELRWRGHAYLASRRRPAAARR